MQLVVDGKKTFAATGGRDHDPALPLVVFIHGAALDHTVWALLARWFAHRGYAVLARRYLLTPVFSPVHPTL